MRHGAVEGVPHAGPGRQFDSDGNQPSCETGTDGCPDGRVARLQLWLIAACTGAAPTPAGQTVNITEVADTTQVRAIPVMDAMLYHKYVRTFRKVDSEAAEPG